MAGPKRREANSPAAVSVISIGWLKLGGGTGAPGNFFLLVAVDPWLETIEKSGEPEELGETARPGAERFVGG